MDWVNLSILLILMIGHTEWIITCINRFHSFAISERDLRVFRHFLDFLIITLPPLILWKMGVTGPRLLLGGSWKHVSLIGWLYVGWASLGVGGFLWSIIRWQLYHLPSSVVQKPSRLVQVVPRTATSFIRSGRYHWMTYLPGNQIFEVERSEFELGCSRLKTEHHGLSILHLTDWHFTGMIDSDFFEQVTSLCEEQPVDLIVFTGDLIDDPDLLDWIDLTLGRLTARLGCYFILGNHDWGNNESATGTRLESYGWIDMTGRLVAIPKNGQQIILAGTSVPWIGNHPDWKSIPQSEETFRILLSHTPDHFRYAQQHHIDLVLAGHTHGGQVMLPVIGPVFAPSWSGVKYASGVFQENETLMFVSRGLEGKHPFRWNCRPEITTLHLVSDSIPEVETAEEQNVEFALNDSIR